MESRQGGLGNPVLIGAWAEFASQPCFDLFPYVTQPEHSCFRWLRRTAKVFPHLFHFGGKPSPLVRKPQSITATSFLNRNLTIFKRLKIRQLGEGFGCRKEAERRLFRHRYARKFRGCNHMN